MNLYPEGHQPFIPRGGSLDEGIIKQIQYATKAHSLPLCVLDSGCFAKLALQAQFGKNLR